MTDDKVVGIRGQMVSQPGKVNEEVVKKAEWLLEAAKAGQIDGVAIALHWSDDAGGEIFAGILGYSIIGRLFSLQQRVLDHNRKK